MLLHRDEDVKSESTSNAEKEDLSAIVSIFQSIKSSEDIYDAVKSKVEYGISLVHIEFCLHPHEHMQSSTPPSFKLTCVII